jgi:hypothetical protein
MKKIIIFPILIGLFCFSCSEEKKKINESVIPIASDSLQGMEA